MIRKTTSFRSLLQPHEMNYLKIAGISFLLFCTSPLPTLADNFEKETATTVQQQAQKITGTVTDEKGESIIGASIKVKGSNTGTITNLDGEFTLNADPKAVLEVTYIGYKPQLVTVGTSKNLNIVLKEDAQALDEVVVVGFGTQKKVNLTGSVTVVDSKQLQSRPVTSVTQALQGLVPGMNFSYATDGTGGELGQNMNINIRGAGSIGTSSKSSPLVLIDGMEGDMNMLNPQDVESISVLKDAAASSIYGSRAPFGVILITTKKGKVGKVSINYNNNFRWTNAINMPEPMDSYTFAQYMNRGALNAGVPLAFDASQLERIKGYIDGTFTDTTIPSTDGKTWDWIGNSNNNWYDIYFGDTAFSQEHSVSANGGTEKIQYFLSGNFMDQTGQISFNPDKLQRYTVTAKINAELFPWLNMSYSTKYMRKDYTKPTFMNNKQFYHDVARRWPTEPMYDPNGNLYSMAKSFLYGGDDSAQTDWLYQQFQVIVEPIKNWKIFGEINYKTVDVFQHTDNLMLPSYDVDGTINYSSSESSYASEAAERTNFFNPNVYTEYLKSFKQGHNLKAMVGFQAELNKYRKIKATKNGLITEQIPNINAATGKEKIDESILNHWATAGFFGRINYDYKERYLLEVNARYDGTSRFSQEKRWNVFPSFSAGWNVAREAFMQPYDQIINNLKVRGSWGELGNQNTTNMYPYIQLMKFVASDPKSDWLINNARPNTANAPDLISTLLGWETMRSWNIGFDLGMFNNRLNVSFDWYNRRTLNMVGPAPELPAILGTPVPMTNNADLQSQGFEVDVTWRDNIGDVRYGVHLLLSDDRQKVLRYPNTTGSLAADTWRQDEYLGEIWGYETIGIAQTDEEMQAHLNSLPKGGQNVLGKNWAAGDVMYADLNNDGKIDGGANTLNDHGDKKIIGNSSPRYKYGIDLDASWKGVDLRIFFQGVAKRDFWFNDNMFWGAAGGKWQTSLFTEHMDFFRQAGDEWGENLNAYFPRPSFDAGKNQQSQTKYLQSAAYCRLKNLQIGYTIPERLTSKLGVSNFRIFFSGENLFTFSPLPNTFDPETVGTGYSVSNNLSGKTHPLSRTFSTGFSVNF